MSRLGGRGRQLLVWAFLLPSFLLPVCLVLGRVVWEPAGRAALVDFLRSPAFRNVLGFTLWESLLSAAGSILLSLPGAYLLGRRRFWGKSFCRSLLFLPFVLPSILAILAMIVAAGRNGLLNHLLRFIFGPHAPQFTGLYGLGGIVLVHVFYNFALGIRLIGEAWERLNPRLEEAASSMGASRWSVWRTLILPLLWPAVATAFVLSFIYASLSFTVVLVLGGLRFRTFEVLIYSRLNQDLDFLGAYAVALAQGVLTGGMLSLRHFVTRRRQRVSSAFSLPAPQPAMGRGERWLWLVYGLLLAFFFLGPLAGLFLQSWRLRGAPDGAFTFANYAALFSGSFRAGAGGSFPAILGASLGLSASVGLATAAIAYGLSRLRASARGGGLDTLIELPLGISFITLCFGLMAAYGRFLPPFPLIALAQMLISLPLGFMVLQRARAELGPEPCEAARSLGASRWRAFCDIELPLLRRPLLTVFAYGAAFSLGDVAAVLILGQGRLLTLTVAVYRLIGHYRFGQALAVGSLLLLLSLGFFCLLDRGGEEGKWLDGHLSA